MKKTLYPCLILTVQLHSAEKWRTGFEQPRTEGEKEKQCCQEEEQRHGSWGEQGWRLI